MHRIRESILRKLMHAPELTFQELWDNEGASNLFSYHLNVLEEDGLIEKHKGLYSLSHTGKKYAAYVDGVNGSVAKFPLVCVFVVLYDHNQDKYLMMKRGKEPFYGLWGFHGGKLRFDQYILECAAAELLEETGIQADLELKGLFSSKTTNNDSLSYNHQCFVIKATNPVGELIANTREGENKWFSREEIGELEIFPNVPNTLEIVDSNHFRWVEADRFQENDEFIGIDVRINTEL